MNALQMIFVLGLGNRFSTFPIWCDDVYSVCECAIDIQDVKAAWSFQIKICYKMTAAPSRFKVKEQTFILLWKRWQLRDGLSVIQISNKAKYTYIIIL